MTKTRLRAFEGVVLAAGAPLGWLLIELARGRSAGAALAADPALYLYMWVGTAVAFGLFGVLFGRREDLLLDSNRRLEDLAVTDPLTGIRNARYFYARLAEACADARRTGKPLAVVMIDLDHFKRVNDRWGHPVGDEVLISTAQAIASITRHGETEARVGGEEFALILPDSTGSQALEVVERVRKAIADARTPAGRGDEIVRITASAGIASSAEHPHADEDELVRLADDALYQAKHEGRDRAVIAATEQGSDAPAGRAANARER